jgi:hypothetical protein
LDAKAEGTMLFASVGPDFGNPGRPDVVYVPLLVPPEKRSPIRVSPWVTGLIVCAWLGLGCGKPTAAVDHGFGRSVLIAGVPHVLQKPDFCGEADVEMYLRFLGKTITQDQVFAASGMDPARGKGATTTELATALERLGFNPGDVWYQVSPLEAERDVMAIWRGLLRDLEARIPSIVCMNTSAGPSSTEHFRLVLGYDADRDEVIYNEPAEEHGAYRRMARARLFKLWPLKYAQSQWTVVRLRLEASKIADPPPSRGFSPSEFVQHVMVLRHHLPRECTVVVEPPFVVLGNGPAEEVHRLAKETVGWAVRRLRLDFFSRDPTRILDVRLLNDDKSYRDTTIDLTGEEPDTPFGFYSPEQSALIMNISTGSGTLVHEIVHPFMEANCPGCPAWFNEGLGSLYEQCSERRGHIVGLPNWRLAELQYTIRKHALPSFRELTQLTGRSFYQGHHSLNYAQARYLLYALQEGGLLVRYYRAMSASLQRDPTGYAALVQVLGDKDMAQFQHRWEEEMLKL